MSHPEIAVRHAPIAAAIPALQHPLRTDPKPRLAWADHMEHLQHLRHMPVRRELPGGIVVDGYLDGVRQVRQ